jgi:hypothetical protein
MVVLPRVRHEYTVARLPVRRRGHSDRVARLQVTTWGYRHHTQKSRLRHGEVEGAANLGATESCSHCLSKTFPGVRWDRAQQRCLVGNLSAIATKREEGYSLDNWIVSRGQFLQSQGIAPSLNNGALLIILIDKASIDEARRRLTGSFLRGLNESFRLLSFAFISILVVM